MLAKPGIVFGNAITMVAGFTMASRGYIDYSLFFAALLGLSFIMSSACILNNYLDREVDKKMKRTRSRALVTGVVALRSAITFATVFGIVGVLILGVITNFLTLLVALFGFVMYVAVYGFLKYHTVHATLIGSLAGATPPVVGYCAVSGCLDTGALLLFLMTALWQMPHFYAIAIYRLDDYREAAIPVLPVKRGVYKAKIDILIYVVLFMVAAFALPWFGFVGRGFLLTAACVNVMWVGLCILGFKPGNDQLWARKIFLFSLIVICSLSIAIAVDTL